MKRTRPPAKPPPGEEGSSFLRTQKRLAVPQDDDLSPTMNSYRIAAGTGGAKGDNFMEHKARTKALSWLLSLAMVLSLLPGMSLTAFAAGDSYIDGSGTSKTVDATELEATTTNWTDGLWYIAPAGGLTISGRITVNGTVNLILRDGATLTANAGITTTGATLNIYAQSEGTGALIATGSNGGRNSTGGSAGIGGCGGAYENNGGAGGTVSIFGGTVTATGGNSGGGGGGAGIGGGGAGLGRKQTGGAGGTVSIFGGTVTATGGNSEDGGAGAGIGGGGKEMRGSAGASGTLTLGAGVKLYNGTNKTGTLLDGSNSTERTYSGSRPKNMFAEYVTPHTHSFTSYTVNTAGDTITATCSAEDCPLEGKTATLTIAAPQHTAVGDGKSADAQITDANKIKGDSAVSYYKANDDNTKGDALNPQTTAPTDGGKYWAEITLGTATAHVVYEITDPEYKVTLPTDLVGGTVTANKTSAKYNDTITLDVAPETGFTIKTVKYNDTTIKANEGVYRFTMPASNVTVSAEFEGNPFGITTEVSPSNGGTVAIGGTGVVTANNVTTAKAGSEVALTVTPAMGFQVDTVKYNNTTITASEGVYKFTMPTEAVTVSATFAGKDTTATLNVTGNEGTTCTAKLLHDDFTDVTNDKPLTKMGGEQFILMVNRDEGYDFTVTYGTANSPVTLTEFTEDEYKAYVDYAKDNNLAVSSSMILAWAMMPGVEGNSVTLTANFAKLKTFTILYQPTDNPDNVWCKFAYTEAGSLVTDSAQMKSDTVMGDGTEVYSLKVTAAFNPEKVAFVTDESNLKGATMGNATVSQNTSSWNNITDGKYLVIGGDAKTVVAAFVTDVNAIPFYNSDRGEVPENYGAGVTYRIAVVANGNPGTVTAPAAPAPSEIGTVFAGWSALVGTAPNKAEIKCDAGGTVQITENTSFSATWEPKQLTVTFNSDGGEGGSDKVTVNYKDKLPDLEAPTKYGFALDGWTVDKSIVQDGNLFFRGSTFDLDTGITSNMGLTAEWKHVHTYTCYQLKEVGLQWFYDDNAVHVAFCSCYDYQLMAHEYGSDGMCACGKHKPEAGKVQLDVSYVQFINGQYETKFKDKTRMEPQGKYVTLSASNLWGSDWSFTKWQYSTDGGNTWKDLAVTTSVKFGVMCEMRVRAVYEENANMKPQVELNASKYDDHFENYPMDNIAFQMSYKLPADCTFVDAGLRFGDNDGIGYYDIKERTHEMSTGSKVMAWTGCIFGDFFNGGAPDTSYTERYYELRKNNALDEMSATELAKYIYEGKTTKAKIDPIYWDSRVKTEGNRGAIATRAPLNMTNAEEGNNWIYGIAWMRYKDADGELHTIYTDALATTLNGIVQGGSKSVKNTAAN